MTTKKQQELIEAIDRLTKEKGYPPTVRELATDRKVYGNAIQEMLKRLQKEGLVTWKARIPRTLKITEKNNA